MIQNIIIKSIIVTLLVILGSCKQSAVKEKISYLSKDEVWNIASNEIIRKESVSKLSKDELNKDEWNIRMNAKWIINPKTKDISYGGGIFINVDPIKGYISDVFHNEYVSDNNKKLLEDEVWQIACNIIKKREPGIKLSRDEWLVFKETKWIVSPKIPVGSLGGGTTLEIDPFTGKVLDYYFTE